MPGDFRSPESTPVDYILLQGVQSPGYAEILNLSAPRRLRIMAGPGFDGAAVAFGGFLEQHFSVKFWPFTDEDWDGWHVFKQLFTKATTKDQKIGGTTVKRALDIWHPFLSDPLYNIHSVVVEDVGCPTRGDDTGGWYIEVKFVSALQPRPSFAKVEGSKDQPLDARDREIQANSQKIGQNEATIDALKKQRTAAPK